jgi:arylsulfatase
MHRVIGLLGLLSIAWIAAVLAAADDGGKDQKPNILVIWGDDIGQSNISAYTMGLVGYRTPNIDRVAAETRTSAPRSPRIRTTTG